MKWRGRGRSSNIDDRRGRGGGGFSPFGRGRGSNMGFRLPSGGRGSGGGIGGIGLVIVIVVIAMAMGFDPMQLLSGSGPTTGPGTQTSSPTANDEQSQFVAVVLQDTEDFWNEVFRQNGRDYPEPTLVLFNGQTSSACGLAQSATGPFYCPGDNQVYIDLGFFDQLHRRFGAPGDFAQAYVLAHEVGHHIQNLTGILPDFNRRRQSMSQAEANAYSIRVELQADCYAGVWGNYARSKGYLDSGDADEALNAAAQIGDDTLQKRSQGFAVPESFNHGTSAQRVKWFKLGFQSGDVGACDTFSVANP